MDWLIHHEYHTNAIALNTARNALVYLVRSKSISKIYIPYYLCDSVSNVCERENIRYEFYHTDENFLPIFERELDENEYLYVVNFYGQVSQAKIAEIKTKYNRIILDNVQAFFEAPVDEVDTIYSCRKFFGVPDGAYLYSDAKHLPLPTDTSMTRMTHILGRFERQSASDFYQDFQTNDSLFEQLPPMYMSNLTHNILGAIDYQQVVAKRNENWATLHKALGNKNKLQLQMPKGPYMYPFYCKNGARIRKALIEKKIYIPTLWPNVLNFEECDLEKDYAQNILPLPCDQRYSEQDMMQIKAEILKWID